MYKTYNQKTITFTFIRAINVCVMFLLFNSCATQPVSMGDAMQEVHSVSIIELLGNPHFYDGQPVRVIGVAQFDFGFEGITALFVSKDDLKYSTSSYIGLGSLDSNVNFDKNVLETLTGKFILVEGIFKAKKRQKIDLNDDTLRICIRACGTSGFIEQINRVDEWGL